MNLERETGITDLFWYVVSKWRLLILALVIGALAAACFSYIRTGKVTVIEEEKEEEGLTAETVTINDLDSYDMAALNLYFQYLELVKNQTDYVTKTEFMKIDPYNARISSASYYVKCLDASNLGGVLEAYMNVCRELNSEYGELFEFNIDKDSEGYEVASDETETEEEISGSSLSGNGIIHITLYANDEKTAQERAKAVEDALASRAETISKEVSPHVLEKIGFYNSRIRSSYLLNKQKSATDSLNSLTNSLNNVKKTFSVNAALYAEKVVNDPAIEDYSDIILSAADKTEIDKSTSSGTKTKVKQPSKSLKKRISKKLMVLGALLLAVIAAILLAIYYLLSRKLRPEDDITRIYGLPSFGLLRDPKRKKRTALDRFIEAKRFRRVNALEGETAEEMLAANIELGAKAAGAKTVYATGTIFGTKEKEWISKAVQLLQDKGITLIAGEPVLENAQALEQMGNSDCTVILEQAGKSDRLQSARLIHFCKERGIAPIGMAVAE